jgi:hypothetical protein
MRAQITAILQLRACTSFSPLDSVVPNPNRTQGKEFPTGRRELGAPQDRWFGMAYL